jgi:endonuclease-8
MPEGDTIFRTARTLHRALAGRTVTRFESVYPQLTRVDARTPLAGQVIERVEARGKHVLMWIGGGLVLRTHMRMHGSWHIYRPGERWQRPRHEMRIALETEAIHAIGFGIPDAELLTPEQLERDSVVRELGPDPLSDHFDANEAVRRLRERGDVSIADALLDQSAIAGIGNVYKSEVLFMGRVHPFIKVRSLAPERLANLVAIASTLLRENVAEHRTTPNRGRRTTGRSDPAARLWVYGRAGQPCRRCGTPISRQAHGSFARTTYWCDRCQPADRDRPQAPGLGPQGPET